VAAGSFRFKHRHSAALATYELDDYVVSRPLREFMLWLWEIVKQPTA